MAKYGGVIVLLHLIILHVLHSAGGMDNTKSTPSTGYHTGTYDPEWWENYPENVDSDKGVYTHFIRSSSSLPVPQQQRKDDMHKYSSRGSKNDRKGRPSNSVHSTLSQPHSTVYITGATPMTMPPIVLPQQLSLVPPYLAFNERPICVFGAVKTFEIINTSEQELLIYGISTDSIHFQVTPFKQATLAPKANISISVHFLPVSLGSIENSIVIQTSVGGVVYQVQGQGVANPYRVTPFVGAKVPLGQPYQPVIELYNPHSEPLEVLEVFTNGIMHLELPATTGTATSLWDIPPHQSRAILRLKSSVGMDHPGRYQGFVTIKTSKDGLRLPIDVHVVKGGVYRIPDELDFGTLTSSAERASVTLSLLNAQPLPLAVVDVHSASSDSSLTVEFSKTVLAPGTERVVAIVHYVGWPLGGEAVGKLVVRTNDTNPVYSRMEVPYRARFVPGSLGYSPLNTSFLIPAAPAATPVVQALMLTNKFPVPLLVYAAEAPDSDFTIVDFQAGTVVPPGGSWYAASLVYQPRSAVPDGPKIVELNLYTNLTCLKVPLQCYHGRLSLSLADTSSSPLTAGTRHSSRAAGNDAEDEELEEDCFTSNTAGHRTTIANGNGNVSATATPLNRSVVAELLFGVLGVAESRTRTFNLTNINPVKVPLLSINSTLDALSVRLEGVWNSHGYATLGRAEPRHAAKRSGESDSVEPFLVLEPGHSAVFTVELTPTIEEQRTGVLSVTTPYETLTIRVSYVSMRGSLTLTPSLLRFDPSFPGRVLRKSLIAKSTFSRTIEITSMSSSDPRFVAVLQETILPPSVRKEIGYVQYDPSRGPADADYLALDYNVLQQAAGNAEDEHEEEDEEEEAEKAERLQRYAEEQCAPSSSCLFQLYQQRTGRLGAAELKRLEAREAAWDRLSLAGQTTLRGTLTINTDVVLGYTVGVRASLTVPSVVLKEQLEFSLTQVGGYDAKFLSVYNPADAPLLVQLLPLEFVPPSSATIVSSAACPFRIPPEALAPAIVAPHTSMQLGPVYFAPTKLERENWTVYLRNNLTVLQKVLLTGEGGSGSLVFVTEGSVGQKGSPPQPAPLPLEFSVTPSLLQLHCSHSAAMAASGAGVHQQLQITKTFVVFNQGNLPVHVESLGINGRGCHQYGFHIHHCGPITLAPGETAEISLSFAPDFSASVVQRELWLFTSAGLQRVPLVATLPYDMLATCLDALPMSDSEMAVRRLCTVFFLAAFFLFSVVLIKEFRSSPVSDASGMLQWLTSELEPCSSVPSWRVYSHWATNPHEGILAAYPRAAHQHAEEEEVEEPTGKPAQIQPQEDHDAAGEHTGSTGDEEEAEQKADDTTPTAAGERDEVGAEAEQHSVGSEESPTGVAATDAVKSPAAISLSPPQSSPSSSSSLPSPSPPASTSISTPRESVEQPPISLPPHQPSSTPSLPTASPPLINALPSTAAAEPSTPPPSETPPSPSVPTTSNEQPTAAQALPSDVVPRQPASRDKTAPTDPQTGRPNSPHKQPRSAKGSQPAAAQSRNGPPLPPVSRKTAKGEPPMADTRSRSRPSKQPREHTRPVKHRGALAATPPTLTTTGAPPVFTREQRNGLGPSTIPLTEDNPRTRHSVPHFTAPGVFTQGRRFSSQDTAAADGDEADDELEEFLLGSPRQGTSSAYSGSGIRSMNTAEDSPALQPRKRNAGVIGSGKAGYRKPPPLAAASFATADTADTTLHTSSLWDHFPAVEADRPAPPAQTSSLFTQPTLLSLFSERAPTSSFFSSLGNTNTGASAPRVWQESAFATPLEGAAGEPSDAPYGLGGSFYDPFGNPPWLGAPSFPSAFSDSYYGLLMPHPVPDPRSTTSEDSESSVSE